MNRNVHAILLALAAALFYALSVPFAKRLLVEVPPVCLAGLLYVGAGVGIGALRLILRRKEPPERRLAREDWPYVAGMVSLDVAAPILLLLGVKLGTSSGASLLGNFEIVATALVALAFFREKVGARLWAAIALLTLASVMLTFEGGGGVRLSPASLLVLGATVCWGFENNCTRRLAEKSASQIVAVKGLCSGTGALLVSRAAGEAIPPAGAVPGCLLLGFVAYGLSIFAYVRAQKDLGAAKTSAYYAAAPFLGAFLSIAVAGESLSPRVAAALCVMLAGAALAVWDTLTHVHSHPHRHVLRHVHGGGVHTHVIVHDHPHAHLLDERRHGHRHPAEELERDLANAVAPAEKGAMP